MNYQYFKEENKRLSGFLSRESKFLSRYPEDYIKVIKYNENGESDLTFKEKLFRYFKKSQDDNLCVCGKRAVFISIDRGYREFCSPSCANKNTTDRIKKVKEEKYGSPNYNNTEKFKLSVQKRTDEEKKLALEKRRETKLKKYGDPDYCNRQKIAESRKKTNLEIKQQTVEDYNLIFLESDTDNLYKFLCKKCNKISKSPYSTFNSKLRKGYDPCPICNDVKTGISREEMEIARYIKSLGYEVESGNRKVLKGYEIDIYVPELKIGFEYNGLYWHSDIRTPKDYHLMKQECASEYGVSLVHIWEDDWADKKEIVKSRIAHLLGKTENIVYARDCVIKEIGINEGKDFLNENHIQGFCPSQNSIGLFYKGLLISVAAFGLRKISGSKGIELLRFCNKKFYNIPGSFSKIFSYYIKNYRPESILTFVDRSWSIQAENLYTKNEFIFLGKTEPNYWYIINKRRKNRYDFRKSELVSQGFDPLLSERKIMEQRGIYRIYDCGQYKYIWNRHK